VQVVHDDFPEETGWTLRDSDGALIAGQLTGSYLNPGGTTNERRNITAGRHTFVMTDVFEDGICCEQGSGSFAITVDGETVISNNGVFLGSVEETFDVSSSNLDDEVVYDCSDPLSGCSTVRHFENRLREAHVSLIYYLGCRYHD
jgi:hypothetical protein